MNIAGHGGGAPADRFVDLLPVNLLRAGGTADAHYCAKRKHVINTHDYILLLSGRTPTDAHQPSTN
jgi:hypothetical protein